MDRVSQSLSRLISHSEAMIHEAMIQRRDDIVSPGRQLLRKILFLACSVIL